MQSQKQKTNTQAMAKLEKIAQFPSSCPRMPLMRIRWRRMISRSSLMHHHASPAFLRCREMKKKVSLSFQKETTWATKTNKPNKESKGRTKRASVWCKPEPARERTRGKSIFQKLLQRWTGRTDDSALYVCVCAWVLWCMCAARDE